MPTDFELLDAWCGGDDKAGNALVERHFLQIYGFFRNKVGGEIDDLIQRTFLACVESRDKFRKESSFRTYLFAVARNELYGHFRRLKRDGPADFSVQSVADLGTTPSRFVVKREEERLLLQALRSIPLDYQIALELYYWDDMSGPELARVLDVPEGTVRTRIRRARKALEDKMATLAKDEGLLKSTMDNFQAWASSVRDYLRNEGRDV